VKRPAFWALFALVSALATLVSIRYFPQAFPIVSLDITMGRERALAEARTIMTRDRLGPEGYRQAASFGSDGEAQTFVELEGGGKDVFTQVLRDGLYAAYTWRVRQFKEGETNETTIRFTPDGRAYGFVERVKEDATGAALDAVAARRIAEEGATARWQIDLSRYQPVEQGQDRRTGGRVDHTFTYERPSPTLNEGRYRLRLVVAGDRLTEVTPFIKIPEAFSRRYASMRSANEAIGQGSAVGLALLYVFGGIGVGLFVMLRQRWVLWRHAAVWGLVVAGLQALAAINELPLAWMSYDTALPRSTFIAQEAASIVAQFIGFSVFFALSFMAAETLGRRAFGSHPQFWRVWSRDAGASTAVLGQTVGGLLLVAVFFAYDVMLYLFATKVLGWWSPSEALLHPDVLATYVPWLSAIANSFQAGFWEEALFRAVPLAGAALIGDRFGKRGLFLVAGFVVQSLIFGAGHAPYPNQPSYARPVELILPSIGFGLLYLYFGLLPAIVLHFTFDVVWFALPIFLANAPGVWLQKTMVVVMTLVPVWIVLARRAQAGRWQELSASDRNAAWTPPPAAEPVEGAFVIPLAAMSARARTAWLALGAVGIVVCLAALVVQRGQDSLQAGRQQAADVARLALEQRGVTLASTWRVMPVPDSGNGGPHEFVWETAGEPRRRELTGVYLPAPRWRVRIATFEGDVADRAEEWQLFVTSAGEARNVRHTLPEGRPGVSLDEAAARQLAVAALKERLQLDVERGQVREISARPAKLNARTDWAFTFVDTTVVPLPQGEPRVSVAIAGDEVVSAGQFVFVPEDWQRQSRAAATRNTILQVLFAIVLSGLLVWAAVSGVVDWSKRQYAPRLFVAGAAVMFTIAFVQTANNWPIVIASLITAAPLPLQVLGVVGVGLVGLLIAAVMVGLVFGALPRRLSKTARLPDADALKLGIAGGLVGAGLTVAAGWLSTAAWAQAPEVGSFGTFVPTLQVALGVIPGVLTRSALLMTILAAAERTTAGFTRRRALLLVALAVIGFMSVGAPAGVRIGGWLASGVVMAVALPLAYVTLLRFDATIALAAIATMAIVDALLEGASRPFPGALPGSLAAAVVTGVTAWWWFRVLRATPAPGSERT
jgi:membrane protease YdiL (CAAX protease family)